MNPSTNCPNCGAEATGSTPFGTNYSCATVIIKDEEPEHKIRSFLCREREAHNKTKEELEEIKGGMKFIMDEKCAESEVHCGCVPLLKVTLKKSEAENQKLRELCEEAIEELYGKAYTEISEKYYQI